MAPAIYPAYGRSQRINLIDEGNDPKVVQFDSTLTSGSTTVSPVASSLGITSGAVISGAEITTTPPTVTSVGVSLIVLSSAPTVTLSGASLVALMATAGIPGLNGLNVNLYQNTLSPSPATTLAQLQAAVATYDGYAAKTLTMDTGYIDPSGNALAESQLLVWTPTGSVTPNTIGGLWADDGTGAVVIWPLNAPVTLNGPATTLKTVVTDGYPSGGSSIQVLP